MRRFVLGSIVLVAVVSRPVTALGQDCEAMDVAIPRGGVVQYQGDRRYPSAQQREPSARFGISDSTTPVSLMNGLRLVDVSAAINGRMLDLRSGQPSGRRASGVLAVAGGGLQASDTGPRYGLAPRRSAPLFRDTDAVAIGEHWAGIYRRLGLGHAIHPVTNPEPGPLATLIAGLCGMY